MNRIRGTNGGHIIRINGKQVNINLAKIVYRCEECYGKLTRKDFGLKCISNPVHRGFIHRNEVQAIEAKQKKNVEQLKSFYQIKDGKVVINNGN